MWLPTPLLLLCAAAAILYLCSPSLLVKGQFATIAQAYNSTNASRLIQIPGDPYIGINLYNTTGNQVLIKIFSTVRFDYAFPNGNASTWLSTPKRISFVYPWCATTPPLEQFITPASCDGGRLYYGRYSLPAADTGNPTVPIFQDILINGPTAMGQITGTFIPATDIGTLPYYGIVTYIPPVGCPVFYNTSEFDFYATGMRDVGDPTPIEYCDSASGQCAYLTTYGLQCSTASRSANSPLFSPAAVIVPVCTMWTPNGGGDPGLLARMFGSNYLGPTNLYQRAVVYMIRVDNLVPTYYVQFRIVLQYADGTNTTIATETDFAHIEYFASTGTVQGPAFIYYCWGNSQTCDVGSVPVYSEADLGYLQPCNCGVGNLTGNLVCSDPLLNNTVVPLTTPIERNTVPYFSNPTGFSSPPACAIGFATGRNDTTPIQNIPFQLLSGAFGGLAPLQYNWRFVNTPPSAAKIEPPTTGSSVTAVAATAGFYTVEHTVTGANGLSATCQFTINVQAGQPTACYNPTGNIFYVSVGEVVPFDASCSTNPFGTLLSFSWTATSFFNNNSLPFSLSTNTGASMHLTGLFPGSGILYLNVTNEVSTAWGVIYIYVIPVVTPGSAPYAPFVAPLPPTTNCIVPAPPTFIPWLQPSSLPPLNNLPIAPGVPQTVNPSGSSPFNGLLPPGAHLPQWVLTTVVSVLVIGIVGTLVLSAIVPAFNRRRRDNSIAAPVPPGGGEWYR